MGPTTMEDERGEPWWLSGEEACSACEQSYALEMEYRCVECDAPLCPVCVVTVRERVTLCPECAEENE